MMNKSYGFWGSLVRQGTGVSSLNFFLIATTIIGVVLLATPVFAIIWEVLHNNTVSSDISGWAAFVGAVGTLFATAGIAKGWSNWSENKFLNKGDAEEDVEVDIDEEGDAEIDMPAKKPRQKKASKGRRVPSRKKQNLES